jgi:hypothetical protein
LAVIAREGFGGSLFITAWQLLINNNSSFLGSRAVLDGTIDALDSDIFVRHAVFQDCASFSESPAILG